MGKEMRELYTEGVAIHGGPESCVGVREGAREALTGVRAGQAIEPRKDELKRRRHLPIPEQGKWLRSVAQGHLNYYAVPGNLEAVSDFIYELRRLWMKALRRRSQKTRMSWTRYSRLAAGWLPSVRNMHPYPDRRF